MAWDLRRAFLKKQEVETARLLDFEFRLRARSMRLLAERIGLEPADLAREIASSSDEAILASLAERHKLDRKALHADWTACVEQARATLINEIGDPTPHRLA